MNDIIAVARTISQILSAGIAITAFALLLYSLSFNLKGRVARVFMIIMFCLVVVFSAESFSSTSKEPYFMDFWLRVQWIGIILLPASYLNFSDALLATTGLPSRWRRKWAIRLTYAASLVMIVLVFTPWFLGDLVTTDQPAPHHQPTTLTYLFTIYYVVILILAWFNFYRSIQRTLTPTSHRRMLYLTLSAVGPVVGAFPFLLYSSNFAAEHSLFFWFITSTVTAGLGMCIFLMAYAVSFFGVPWPDRVVKSRLIKWTLRGPVTASLALGLLTLVNRTNQALGTSFQAVALIVMVVTVLITEYAITLFYPYIEKWIVYDQDVNDFQFIRSLEERIITRSDLRQFIEMVLAAITDQTRARGAYLLKNAEDGIEIIEKTPEIDIKPDRMDEIESVIQEADKEVNMLRLGEDVLYPLKNGQHNGAGRIYGYLGISGITDELPLETEAEEALVRLKNRAMIALRDREMLEQVFELLEHLDPQEQMIQRLRAAGRFDQSALLSDVEWMKQHEMTTWVKGALTHYWGGPKLTESPLMQMEVVKVALDENDGNEINALRSVLRNGLEQLKPSGERKYTGEWLLYNILDMKFMEGKKVREIALKLAVSEADLYRKQKVAIEKIADILVQMEMKATGRESD
ncbi:MAG: histidine kinase N-terminal 7TM domain-containing protein [Anaerolineaceae bacterium]|jgi:hypothetical protein